MSEALLSWVSLYGAPALFLVTALGCFGVPLPSSLALLVAGALVAGGDLDPTSTLVAALNAAAGPGTWAFVPSSSELPPASEQDVITNAIIYRTSAVTTEEASPGKFTKIAVVEPPYCAP